MAANIGGIVAGILLAHIALKILERFRSSQTDHS